MLVMGYDGKMVAANLPNLERALHKGVRRGLLDAGLEGLRLSQAEVPHDEGTLQNSGTVEVLSNGDVVLGYHTPYAARLHEHPEYRFQKGRKGKYISDPLERNQGPLGIRLQNGFNSEVKN